MTKILVNISLNSTNNVNIGRLYDTYIHMSFIFLKKSFLCVELKTTFLFKCIKPASSSSEASIAIKTGVLALLVILN